MGSMEVGKFGSRKFEVGSMRYEVSSKRFEVGEWCPEFIVLK